MGAEGRAKKKERFWVNYEDCQKSLPKIDLFPTAVDNDFVRKKME